MDRSPRKSDLHTPQTAHYDLFTQFSSASSTSSEEVRRGEGEGHHHAVYVSMILRGLLKVVGRPRRSFRCIPGRTIVDELRTLTGDIIVDWPKLLSNSSCEFVRPRKFRSVVRSDLSIK